jgi:cytochrome c oxidase subunit II
LCVLIAAAVLSAMIWSIFRHRRSTEGRHPASLKAEVAWTVVPIFILVAMAAPAADTILRSQEHASGDFDVKVTGYQWKWEFEYPELGIRYSSLRYGSDAANAPAETGALPVPTSEPDADLPLVVPAGTRVQVALTAADVNHGWWIRAFGRQRNAIPGHINEFSFRAREPGFYRGECTEFCGPPETCVPIAVRALPPEEFAAWRTAMAKEAEQAADGPRLADTRLERAPASLQELFSQGQILHARNCAGCHQASGQGLRAAGFPPLAGTQLSKDEHIRIALHGREGSAMAAFGPLLDDRELAAIVTFQRNAWGNDTGDVIAPAEVAAAR